MMNNLSSYSDCIALAVISEPRTYEEIVSRVASMMDNVNVYFDKILFKSAFDEMVSQSKLAPFGPNQYKSGYGVWSER